MIVTWNIEKGYYLYKKSAWSRPCGVGFRGKRATRRTPLAQGESHKDEYFGEQEIYRDTVDVPVPITFHGTRPAKLAIELSCRAAPTLGCAIHLRNGRQKLRCLQPPHLQVQICVHFSTLARPATMIPAARRGVQIHCCHASARDSVTLNWIIANGYYLYKSRISVASQTAKHADRQSRAAER